MSRSSLEENVARLGDRARALLLEASGVRSKVAARPSGEPLRVLLTIDTEISMGGALRDPNLAPVGPRTRIWGETKNGCAGIDLFMDLFDEFDMQGVFFFEVCGRNVVEEEALAGAARHIVERGHSIELHIHPEFRVDIEAVRSGHQEKPSALFRDYNRKAQRELLTSTADKLEAWTGQRPVAFRAGGYGADDASMDAVVDAALPIDSSYNLWSIQLETCGFTEPQLNDVALHPSGVVEVPVTCYEASGPRGGLRQFDLAATNTSEAIAILEAMYQADARLATTVTHSFRLLRTTDVQYSDARPDPFNIHRVRALCRFLADNRDRFEVCTYRDLPLKRWQQELGDPAPQPFLPAPPRWTSLLRLAVQAVKDRGAL